MIVLLSSVRAIPRRSLKFSIDEAACGMINATTLTIYINTEDDYYRYVSRFYRISNGSNDDRDNDSFTRLSIVLSVKCTLCIDTNWF